MYNSPIEIIYGDIQHSFEEGIFKAIQDVDIKVDKDELLKALAYDRSQYEKGYADAKAERKKGKWYLRDTTRYGGLPYICTACSEEANAMYNFCPQCGAKMQQ